MLPPYYLQEGAPSPDVKAFSAFIAAAKKARPDINMSVYDIRWIGWDADSTAEVLELIRSGDKTGTFSLPWLVELTNQPTPRPGLPLVFIDYAGRPAVLAALTEALEIVPFGDIEERHTAIDGPPVRDLAVWKPLHIQYWNNLLKPFGKEVADDMPVIVEPFDVLYDVLG